MFWSFLFFPFSLVPLEWQERDSKPREHWASVVNKAISGDIKQRSQYVS